MTVHLKKLSVGTDSLESLISRQKKAVDELLDGGSLYWIIKGQMVARQPIKEFVEVSQTDSKPKCGIVLAPGLVPVLPKKVRIFQGWRYLEDIDVPADLPANETDEMPLPVSLIRELRELGLL